jgi:hypothetical protein
MPNQPTDNSLKNARPTIEPGAFVLVPLHGGDREVVEITGHPSVHLVGQWARFEPDMTKAPAGSITIKKGDLLALPVRYDDKVGHILLDIDGMTVPGVDIKRLEADPTDPNDHLEASIDVHDCFHTPVPKPLGNKEIR